MMKMRLQGYYIICLGSYFTYILANMFFQIDKYIKSDCWFLI